MTYAGSDRRSLQISAYKIWAHDYADLIHAELGALLNIDNYNKFAPYVRPQRNVLRRVVAAVSHLYDRSPRRRSENSAANLLRTYCPTLNHALRMIQERLNAIGDVFAMPYWSEADQQVLIDIIDAPVVEVKLVRSSVEYIQIAQDGKQVRYYADGRISEQLHRNGSDVWSAPQSTAWSWRPITWYSLGMPTEAEPWAIYRVRDLLDCTIAVGVMETYRNRGHYLRAQRIPVMADKEAIDDAEKSNPTLPASLSDVMRGDLKAVALADEDDKFLTSIRAEIQDVAAPRGLSLGTLYREFGSTDQIDSITTELRQAWQSSREIMAGPEKSLIRSILYLVNLYSGETVDPDTRVTVDYLEPIAALEDRATALGNLKSGIELGVDNIYDYLGLQNADLESDEEIEAYVRKNIDLRAKLVQQMRELNMPADPTQAGLAADRNGANGPPAASAALTPREDTEDDGQRSDDPDND